MIMSEKIIIKKNLPVRCRQFGCNGDIPLWMNHTVKPMGLQF